MNTPSNPLISRPILLLANPTEWMDRYGGNPRVGAPIRLETREDGHVRLLDILGGVDPDWIDPARATGNLDHIEIAPEDWERVTAIVSNEGGSAALLALTEDMANLSDEWESFASALNDNRFEASAWFERDRKNLVLTDKLTGEDIITLWDDEVDEALEDGFLIRPKMFRPQSNDWVEPLKELARSQGLLQTANIRLDRSKIKMPQAEQQEIERPGESTQP